MGARAQAILPLALVIGVLSFLWTELSLNFTFHWVTVQDELGGEGALGMPESFHLILPTAFISWGLFFAAGGDNAAVGKIAIAALFGCAAAFVTMPLAFKTADAPDFWGIALWVGIFAFILVAILIAGDWYYVAGTFPCFAAVFLWWIATGLDGWIPQSATSDFGDVAKLGTADAGIGAGGGLLSTPWQWVAISTFVTLLCGVVLGLLSGKIAAAITPKPKSAEA